MTAPSSLTCNYASLVNDVAFDAFGLRPTATDVISEGLTDIRADQILRAIRKGLQFVYNSYRWSFLRPKISISTYPAYTTGTITVDASGNVTLNAGVAPADGGFPSYTVTSAGRLEIKTVVASSFYGGSWMVGTRSSATALVLTGYAASGAPAFATAVPYSLAFNIYPISTGYDSFEGQITFAPGWDHRRTAIARVDPMEIRRRLQYDAVPRRPEMYALFTDAFDPTGGSTRHFSFWPVPDKQYQLEVDGTWQPAMLDSSNKYPLGGTLLSAVITEACLAAAERDIKQQDAGHPDAVHSRAVGQLLQFAIQRDREYSAPDSLGVDRGGPRSTGEIGNRRQTESIYFNNVGGYTGYL